MRERQRGGEGPAGAHSITSAAKSSPIPGTPSTALPRTPAARVPGTQQQAPATGAAAAVDMLTPAPANAKEALLALPEIAVLRIPNNSSLAELAQFLKPPSKPS